LCTKLATNTMADKIIVCMVRDWCANIKYQNAKLNNPAYEYQQDRQCTYNMTVRHIHVTIVAVQNQ